MSFSAKVSAWLETMSNEQDDKTIDDVQDLQKPNAGTAAGSLHLEPITTDSSPRNIDSAFVRKTIPPIVSGSMGSREAWGDKKARSGKDDVSTRSRLSGNAEDILATVATVTASTPSLSNDDLPEPEAIVEGRVTPRDVDTVITGGEGSKVSSLFKQKLFVGEGQDAHDKTTVPSCGDGEKSGSAAKTFGTITSLIQWKRKYKQGAERRRDTIAIDARHESVMKGIENQIKVELPHSLSYAIKEEVLPMLHDNVQAYKSEVGRNHRLTRQAQEKLEDLTGQLRNHAGSDSRLDSE
ncbi:uncharacterized protein LOC116608845 [Nematostella vectensis]|uniref:uncharacterized protein LOC116608845 n=1 Tax=Nematostella vectensis TaxID=45351 RepID=UPI00138FDC81|nr:uncharacterized protein LOC116608845 [Nematostella vectensis]